MDTRELRTTALGALDSGDIWGTRSDGVFVIVSSRAARWHGEDIDVYAHIDTWYTVRDATETERALWDAAVTAAAARKRQRAELHVDGWEYQNGQLHYSLNPVNRLDSYDDRWEPPAPIALTPEQQAVEETYIAARAVLKGHG